MWMLTAALALACPPDTASLPSSAWFAPDDARLGAEHLLVALKEQREIAVYRSGVLAGCWDMALAWDYPSGSKVRQGDRRTPEGFYRTSDKPWSSYHGAIAVHYPGVRDARRGLADGLVSQAQHDAIVQALAEGRKPDQNTPLGGEILIHGGGSSQDWTLGCLALEDADIDALRAALDGDWTVDVLILP